MDCLPCLARNAVELVRLSVAGNILDFSVYTDLNLDKPIAFLFLAKCPVVCRTVGAEPKTIQVILHNFN